jgi:hypothetical protein
MTNISLPMFRVLQALSAAKGPLTITKIAARIRKNKFYVRKAIGYTDPEPSLLSLGYVRMLEVEVEIDGMIETGYLITAEGRELLLSVLS